MRLATWISYYLLIGAAIHDSKDLQQCNFPALLIRHFREAEYLKDCLARNLVVTSCVALGAGDSQSEMADHFCNPRKHSVYTTVCCEQTKVRTSATGGQQGRDRPWSEGQDQVSED